MRLRFLLIMTAFSLGAAAQRIQMNDLFNMLDWTQVQIDTTLKKEGYILMQKDVDSLSSIYQYSPLERPEGKPAVVRSFVFMDVKSGDNTTRLVNYRTYSQEEYVDIARWLLENAYQTKNKFDLGNEQHTEYSNGKETLRMKIIKTKIDEGKEFTSYEVEIGK